MTKSRNSALIFIFITLLIDITGLGIIIPVLPQILAGFEGGDISQASAQGGRLMAVYAFMQFFCSPIIGGLSDQFGRRPVLLASLFGFGIDYIILGFAPSLTWLYIGRVLAGITGASFTTAGAYIADVSSVEDRAKNFGIIGAAFGLGFIFGPSIGGWLGQFGERMPFFVAAGFSLLNGLYGFFILPESLKPENRRPFDWKRANPVGTLKTFGKSPILISLIGAIFCLYVAGQVYPSVWAYFSIKQFHWSSKEIGLSLGFVGLTAALVQGGLSRVVIPKIGERKTVIVGLLFYAFGFLLFSMASHGWMMYAFLIPASLGGLGTPALQGIISKEVSPSEQGELQGGMTSLMSLSAIMGPVLATSVFSYFTSGSTPVYFPGAPFLVGSLLTIIALLIIIRTFRIHKKSK